MSKERLERIKRESKGVVWNTETDEDLLTELDTPDFNWLIEQVEHSIPIKEHNKILLEFRVQNEQLLKQNKRYRNRIEKALYFVKHSTNEPDKVLIMQEYLEKLLESESE